MQVGVLRSEDGKSDCGLPTSVHHGPNFPHKPRLGLAVARKLSRFRQNPCIFLVCPQIWSRLSEGIIIQASSQTQPKVLTLSPPQTEPKSQTPHKLKSTTLKQNLDIRPQPKNCPIFHFGAMYHYIFLGVRIMLEIYQNPEFNQLTNNLISLRHEEENSPVKRSEER